jgi:hypothetical protein
MTSDPNVEERLDCIDRNLIRFRPDIREIVREETKSVVEDALSKMLKELRKPQPHVEVGYR